MSEINIYNPAGKLVATFPSDYTVRVSSRAPQYTGGWYAAAQGSDAKAPPISPVPMFSVRKWLRYIGATPSSEVEDRKCQAALYQSYKQFAGRPALSPGKFNVALREEGYPDGKAVDRYFGMKLTNVTSKLG
jgi:hypothetical protein